MEINLTFCVQVINFLLFYYGISYFFLKPFVKFIQLKTYSRERMLEEFASKELQLKKLVQDRVELAQQFRQGLKDRHKLPTIVPLNIPEERAPAVLTKQQQTVMATQLAAHFVVEVKNAY